MSPVACISKIVFASQYLYDLFTLLALRDLAQHHAIILLPQLPYELPTPRRHALNIVFSSRLLILLAAFDTILLLQMPTYDNYDKREKMGIFKRTERRLRHFRKLGTVV